MPSPEPRRYPLLGLVAYALVPGERRVRAARHFRRAGVEWQKDLPKLAKWSKQTGFDVIDFTHRASGDDYQTLKAAGLGVGSIDLLDFGQIMANDAGKRKDVLEANLKYVKEAAALGKPFFACIIPADPAKKSAPIEATDRVKPVTDKPDPRFEAARQKAAKEDALRARAAKSGDASADEASDEDATEAPAEKSGGFSFSNTTEDET